MAKANNRIRGTIPKVERAARQLRHHLTEAEALLWKALRNRQLKGLRWRRQHPIGHFIVDFYCPSCRLVVEVDGEIHQQQQDYDLARTEHLEKYELTVLHFKNAAVETSLQEV
ncbi:endonuclease domain-containing protein [Acaryochloris sp. IP29b_bin.148]|uniref:endonuclease domain-containing protein n=1 Tax=Acaryochloris sp. IP29b_bin.148 TaxID=2969218 RepID=UPI00261453D0|nr:endonuclease domain-containing protein [Acaryochloris sp. IP29b_bin.148]